VKPSPSTRLSLPGLCSSVAGSGCATTANNPKDPFEGFNRAMFAVNEGLDVVVKPVAQGYDTVAPLPVKVVVGNFFGNIWDAWTAVNNLLQGKGGQAASDVGRVLINSTVGIGGAFDVAGEMGLTKHSEEFGQTLGVWGVGDGPYFYWPLIGPRTTRDTFGWLVDTYYDPVWRHRRHGAAQQPRGDAIHRLARQPAAFRQGGRGSRFRQVQLHQGRLPAASPQRGLRW
jgi:phospholipid-binding lipoprotein MlaA